MADVEDAHGLPDCGVLLDHPGVLQRHLPPTELGELRTQGDMTLVQGGTEQRRGGRARVVGNHARETTAGHPRRPGAGLLRSVTEVTVSMPSAPTSFDEGVDA